MSEELRHRPFVLLHTQPGLHLSTDNLLLPPEQAPALQDALACAAEMARLQADAAAHVQAQADAGHAQGYAAGHEQGHVQARAEGAQALARTLQALQAQSQAQATALQQQAVALALLVVRRVAADLAPADVLTALARKAVEHLASSPIGHDPHAGDGSAPAAWDACQLRLNPALLPEVLAHLREQETPQAKLRLVADDSLAPLDCVLETPGGRVLAGLEIQLERVQARLAHGMRPHEH